MKGVRQKRSKETLKSAKRQHSKPYLSRYLSSRKSQEEVVLREPVASFMKKLTVF
ncbi:hypothetical protein BVRB_3g061330 [Beta vulgaris subsp. vulgaris]|nr:hypothetical protein BVRB_3g061330 [Beta vulgaris subsp. vulgaris]